MTGDENNPRDMAAFIRCVGFVQERTGAHVLVVHHTGKDEGRGPRCHSSLRGAADAAIEITRLKDTSVCVATVVT